MKSRLARIAPLVVLAAVAGAVLWYTVFRDQAVSTGLTASGTVEAVESHLGFQLAGRIASMAVREGDAVTAGQELAALDQSEALAHRDQGQAQIAAARAALRELERGARPEEVAQAEAARTAARVRLEDATRDRERTERLQAGGAVSMEALDKARMAEDLARTQYDQVSEQLGLVRAGPRQERIEAQRAQLQSAEASLRVLEISLNRMTLRAPTTGVVSVRDREPGEIVPPGAAVLTITDLEQRWVRIFVPEDQIGAVSLGQPASIRSDTWPDRTYDGEVTFISSEAEFTPKNVQTPQERVKLVYAVKVRITGDPGFELKPGMPADVHLEVAGM